MASACKISMVFGLHCPLAFFSRGRSILFDGFVNLLWAMKAKPLMSVVFLLRSGIYTGNRTRGPTKTT